MMVRVGSQQPWVTKHCAVGNEYVFHIVYLVYAFSTLVLGSLPYARSRTHEYFSRKCQLVSWDWRSSSFSSVHDFARWSRMALAMLCSFRRSSRGCEARDPQASFFSGSSATLIIEGAAAHSPCDVQRRTSKGTLTHLAPELTSETGAEKAGRKAT